MDGGWSKENYQINLANTSQFARLIRKLISSITYCRKKHLLLLMLRYLTIKKTIAEKLLQNRNIKSEHLFRFSLV